MHVVQAKAVGTAQAMAWALFPLHHSAHAQFLILPYDRVIAMLKFLICVNYYPSIIEKPHKLVAFNFPKREYGKQVVTHRRLVNLIKCREMTLRPCK